MNIHKFTKDSIHIKLLFYELLFRWELTIKPGLNNNYKIIINNLIHSLLNNKYLDIKEKIKLYRIFKEIN
jgi:hypothetical protein